MTVAESNRLTGKQTYFWTQPYYAVRRFMPIKYVHVLMPLFDFGLAKAFFVCPLVI